MNRLIGLVAALFSALLMIAAPAMAAPLAYQNAPFDTPNSAVNSVISSINSTQPAFSYATACSGTTTATCTGLRFTVSITGLTTAAGVTATAMTVTDTSVTAASMVMCQVLGYGGTGNPIAVNVVPTASTLVLAVQNTHASAALNATVPIACLVYN